MFQVARDDVLLGLKRFRRLAKQDLLASAYTSNPEYWQRQAEARRETYARLMELVESDGVEAAYHWAMAKRSSLSPPNTDDPTSSGQRQALDLFLALIGVRHWDEATRQFAASKAVASL